MLGLEHETLRGTISIEYYGRNVGIKIMPTGEERRWGTAVLAVSAAGTHLHQQGSGFLNPKSKVS
jgi:hypothetical protein